MWSHSQCLDWTLWSFLGKENQHLLKSAQSHAFTEHVVLPVKLLTLAGLPGLLSLSSLSSRPPETPLSLDWSCTFIFSLLLILHTEVLEDMKWGQMLALRENLGCYWEYGMCQWTFLLNFSFVFSLGLIPSPDIHR